MTGGTITMLKRIDLKKIPLLTRILLLLSLACVIAVVVVGLEDVKGIILGMAAAILVTLEWTRRWHSIRKFVFLAVGTFLVALILSGLYMELANPLALRIGGPGALENAAWQIFSIILSDTMLLVGPGCIVIGAAGTIILSILRLRRWWEKKHAVTAENLTPSTL